MTIEHMPDGSKQYTSPEGVVTRHADYSAAMMYRDTGKRAAYETPDGRLIDPTTQQQAPAGEQAPAGQQGQTGRNALEDYRDRCRNQGKARAARVAEGGK